MHAVILSIGDELVLGQTVDTNSAFLAAELARRGVATLYHHTVADDQAWIARAIRQAAQAAELVLVSGGLGPTDDDLTRQALAQAMGVDLVLDEPSVAKIAGFFTRRGRPMPERNRVQALHPRGSTMLDNDWGTAPGIKATLDRATVYVMPGVPREMVNMFAHRVAPELDQPHLTGGTQRHVILTAKINTFGVGESAVAERLGPLMARDRNPKVGTTVSHGIVAVRVRAEFDDPAQAQRQLDDTVRQVEAALGSIVFGREEDTLGLAVVTLLRERALTLAVAESCTGGWLGAIVTDVPGASAVFRGGWLVYDNAMKREHLGVPAALLETHGAVSEPVVAAMAIGSLQRSGADLALAITGIAGPEGGTADKPVGTVWIALACRDAAGGRPRVRPMCFHLTGDRQAIRDRAAKSALQLLRLHLLDAPLDALQWSVPKPATTHQTGPAGATGATGAAAG